MCISHSWLSASNRYRAQDRKQQQQQQQSTDDDDDEMKTNEIYICIINYNCFPYFIWCVNKIQKSSNKSCVKRKPQKPTEFGEEFRLFCYLSCHCFGVAIAIVIFWFVVPKIPLSLSLTRSTAIALDSLWNISCSILRRKKSRKEIITSKSLYRTNQIRLPSYISF